MDGWWKVLESRFPFGTLGALTWPDLQLWEEVRGGKGPLFACRSLGDVAWLWLLFTPSDAGPVQFLFLFLWLLGHSRQSSRVPPDCAQELLLAALTGAF